MADRRSLTDFEHVLLGLLALRPMSGYDIKKAFASSPLGRYSPSSGGLYPALHRLEKQGLLVARVERPDELRGRRVFAPSEAGLVALDQWLHQPLGREDVTQRMEYVMMRFALMGGRSKAEQVSSFLRQLAAILRPYLAELEAYAEAARPVAGLHQRLSVEHGIAVCRARLLWAEAALSEVLAAPEPVATMGPGSAAGGPPPVCADSSC